MNNIESLLKILVSGVLHGSVLGPILFSLVINDLFLFIKTANLADFADDNAIYLASKYITGLLEILKSELEEAINWFKTNNMFADKFQTIVVHYNKSINENYTLKLLSIW